MDLSSLCPSFQVWWFYAAQVWLPWKMFRVFFHSSVYSGRVIRQSHLWWWKSYCAFVDISVLTCVRICKKKKVCHCCIFSQFRGGDLRRACMLPDLNSFRVIGPVLSKTLSWVSLWLWAQGTHFYFLLIIVTVTQQEKLTRQKSSFGSI